MMKVNHYLHSDKETNYELGQEIGLSEDALRNFKYCLYEVEFELEVDENGEYEILKVDGRELK
jgi:hypothetical protein